MSTDYFKNGEDEGEVSYGGSKKKKKNWVVEGLGKKESERLYTRNGNGRHSFGGVWRLPCQASGWVGQRVSGQRSSAPKKAKKPKFKKITQVPPSVFDVGGL